VGSMSAVDEQSGRKFYLEDPDELGAEEEVVFLLNLHGGGSVGRRQQAYFPAVDYKEAYRLVVLGRGDVTIRDGAFGGDEGAFAAVGWGGGRRAPSANRELRVRAVRGGADSVVLAGGAFAGWGTRGLR
jgi:hypothetical protein